MKKGKIFVFSAASGCGKSTILEYVRTIIPDVVYSISATTRKPRGDEKDGVHYFFLTVDQFRQKIAENDFAEWAIVHGNYYGTPKSFINETTNSGKHIVMDIDVFGKVVFDKVYPDATGIFIKPPSLEELRRRLKNRNTDSDETIEIRLDNAIKEMAFADEKGKYEFKIINDDLEKAKEEVVTIIKNAIDAV